MKKIIVTLCLTTFLLAGCASGNQSEEDGNSDKALTLESVALITEVFGDGQKTTAAALQYSSDVDPNSLSMEGFLVEGQSIVKVYTNSEAATSTEGVKGRFVIVEFDYESSNGIETSSNGMDGKQGGQGESPGGQSGGPGGMGGGQGGPPNEGQGRVPSEDIGPDGVTDVGEHQNNRDAEKDSKSSSITVTQIGDVVGIDGAICPGSDAVVESDSVINLVVDDFLQFEYTDPKTGDTIPYNLFLPENYDENKSYPLLFFVADASVNSEVVTAPLTQGLGAVIWATPEEQAKHECIVLAPQYTTTLSNSIGSLTEDDHQWSEGLTLVTNLLFDVIEQYNVDESRIYGTGQSQGCMTNIAISDQYPDLFAAQLLVAGQWDTEEMSAMKDKHLWIVVCEGDNKAYPGMTEATANWASLGTSIATSEMWESLSTAEEFDFLVGEMEAQGCNINFTVFSGGNHNYTWKVAYTIEGIRDWIFAQ